MSDLPELNCQWRMRNVVIGMTMFDWQAGGLCLSSHFKEGFHLKPGNNQTVLHFESTTSFKGLESIWFRCPTCSKRVSTLYYKKAWECRLCSDLIYASQRMDRKTRLTIRYFDLKNEIGEGRPKGMHQSTYEGKYAKFTAVIRMLESEGYGVPNAETSNTVTKEWRYLGSGLSRDDQEEEDE